MRRWSDTCILLYDSADAGDTSRCDELLADLEQEFRKHSENEPSLFAELARELFNATVWADESGDRVRHDRYLTKLRLHAYESGRPAPQSWLAKALFNACNHAMNARDAGLSVELIAELRALRLRWPRDRVVRARLAMAINNGVIEGLTDDTGDLADSLLNELRDLVVEYPDDLVVRRRLARGLVFRLIDAANGDDILQAQILLSELREQHGARPSDVSIAIWLANGLNYMRLTLEEDEPESSAELVAELRSVAEAHPRTKKIWRWISVRQ